MNRSGLLTRPRLAGPLVAAVAALALAASADEARADGDPASDVVNAQLLYVSYQYPPPNPLVTQLGGLLERTRDKGYEVRVVVLSDRYDMGSVDSLWRKPQQYARFLAQEIAPLYKGPLLVVMPNGYGFNYRGHESRRELKLLSTVPIEANDGILRSTATAVRRLAAAAGVRVTAPPLKAAPTRNPEPSPLTGYRATKGSGVQTVVTAVAIGSAFLLAAAAVLLAVQRRRRGAGGTD